MTGRSADEDLHWLRTFLNDCLDRINAQAGADPERPHDGQVFIRKTIAGASLREAVRLLRWLHESHDIAGLRR